MPFHITMETNHKTYTMALSLNERHNCLKLYDWAFALPLHYEPPGQNVSIVSQICLILVSNCLKRSQFCLKHVSDKMSQFGLNLRPFWHLRYNWDCPYLRAIWDIFLRCQKSVKKVSKISQKGILGDLVDGRSFQVPSLYIQTLWFHN